MRSSSTCCVGTHPPKIDDNLLSFGGLVTSYRTGFITYSNLRQFDITLGSQVTVAVAIVARPCFGSNGGIHK